MLKLIAISKRGKKQLKRHGDVWVPVEGNRQVGCLGGVPGIKLMSVKDKATFWMKVEKDENLVPVERLDNFGRPMQGKHTVTLSEMIEQGQRRMADPLTEARKNLMKETDEQVLTGTVIKRNGTEEVISEYSVTGVSSGRTCASGEPNQSSLGHTADEQPATKEASEVAA